MDLRRIRPAEQGLLPRGASRYRALGFLGADRGAGSPDHLISVAGGLEDPRDHVGVNPDAGRLGFHADVAAGEDVGVRRPPAAPAGVTAELDERLALRGADAV